MAQWTPLFLKGRLYWGVFAYPQPEIRGLYMKLMWGWLAQSICGILKSTQISKWEELCQYEVQQMFQLVNTLMGICWWTVIKATSSQQISTSPPLNPMLIQSCSTVWVQTVIFQKPECPPHIHICSECIGPTFVCVLGQSKGTRSSWVTLAVRRKMSFRHWENLHWWKLYLACDVKWQSVKYLS